MQIIRPHDFTAQIAELRTELRLWLLQILAWLAEFAPLPRDARLWLQQQLLHVRRDLRLMIAAAVVSKMRFPKRSVQRAHKRKMPKGYRWTTRRGPAIRFFTRGIKLRTFAQMRRVLDDFDAVADRAFANLPRDLRGGILVLTHAQKPVAAPFFIAPAAEAADTS